MQSTTFTKTRKLAHEIIKILEEHGPKSTRQLTELLTCENIYGELASPHELNAKILSVLQSLYSKKHAIIFSSQDGKWMINNKVVVAKTKNLNSKFVEIDLTRVKFKEMGHGQEYVYALYLPIARYNAALNDWKLYPIKIGRTKNLLSRISALSFTGPGMLIPGVVFRTDTSQLLEKELHKILNLNRAQINLSGRREWFRSNIMTIENYYNFASRNGVI